MLLLLVLTRFFLVVAASFVMLSAAHETHHFYADHFVKTFTPDQPKKFTSVIRKEMMLLRSSLPKGILIRGFENAMVIVLRVCCYSEVISLKCFDCSVTVKIIPRP